MWSNPSLSLSLLSLFTVPGVNADSSDLGVMEGRGHSVGGSDESPSEAEVLSEREERLTGAYDEQMSPDCSEDMEDSDSVASERLLSSSFRAEGLGLISSPDWALAFFGEECFSPDVIQYAGNLGQHTGSPCLDVKAQVGKATMATASESSLTLTLSVWTNGRCHDLFISFHAAYIKCVCIRCYAISMDYPINSCKCKCFIAFLRHLKKTNKYSLLCPEPR